MGARATKGKRAVAADVWRTMASYSLARIMRGPHLPILRELGLTPGHLKALSVLDPEEPRPMRAMADALMCDPSMATWFVDRLEERGLVERRPHPTDRRVKTVSLTPLGLRTRARVIEALFEPPEELMELDGARLDTIRDALAVLPPIDNPFRIAGDGPTS